MVLRRPQTRGRAENLRFQRAFVGRRISQRGTKPYGFFPLWNPYSSLVIRGSPSDGGSVLIEKRGRAENLLFLNEEEEKAKTKI